MNETKISRPTATAQESKVSFGSVVDQNEHRRFPTEYYAYNLKKEIRRTVAGTVLLILCLCIVERTVMRQE